MLDARFSHLYFYQSLNRLQRGLSAIAELLVGTTNVIRYLRSDVADNGYRYLILRILRLL